MKNSDIDFNKILPDFSLLDLINRCNLGSSFVSL